MDSEHPCDQGKAHSKARFRQARHKDLAARPKTSSTPAFTVRYDNFDSRRPGASNGLRDPVGFVGRGNHDCDPHPGKCSGMGEAGWTVD